MKKIIILICLTLFAFGCGQKGTSSSTVLVTVKGAKITKDIFLKEFSRLPEWAKAKFQNQEGKEQFLNELIKKELLYGKAKKQGLEKDKEYMAALEEFKKMELISLLLKKEIEGKVKVTDEDVKTFYDKHSYEFKAGEEVKVSHILTAAEAEAQTAYEKIKKGESFAAIAKQVSRDKASAQRGGDLGSIKHGQMVPEFDQYAFRLKVGEMSAPFKTRFGYHIIKVTGKKEGTQLAFDQIKEAVKRRLMAEKQKDIFDTMIEDLKKEAKLNIDKKALEAVEIPKAEVPQTPPHGKTGE
ncbi:MAG: peptidylprolyl isomerase [Nitrospirae bacterium]|nr:peptidylprolyl isomerase [Nitrospirota bacterium]